MAERTGVAAVFTGAGRPLETREFPVLPPAPGDALLALARSGVCGTDVHIVEGRLAVPAPLIPGHEFIGRIEALGTRARRDGLGAPLRVGDAAVACVALPCGKCFSCARGETASCLNFGVTYVRDPQNRPHFFGGYAEFLHAPAKTLVKLPKGVDLDAAAAFPCAGPTVIRAFDYAGGLERGELVVVQGAGPVGLFAVAWAAAAGAVVAVIGSGSSPARLRLARALGAKLALDYRAVPAEERAARITALAARLGRANGADVVFEASGSPTAFPEGLRLVRTRGRYIVPGQYSNSGPVSIEPQMITFKAVRIVGSGQYTMQDIGAYLEFLRRRRDLQKVFARCVTHRFPVRRAQEACRCAAEGRAAKVVLVPQEVGKRKS